MNSDPFCNPGPAPNRSWRLDGPRMLRETILSEGCLDTDQVRIGFRFCGICGSDISTFEGRRNTQFPISLGHEFLAVVEAVGSNVLDVGVGDMVVSDLNYRCGDCEQCKDGNSHLCIVSGIGSFTNRAFSLRADILPDYLVKVPGDILQPHYCLAEPLSCVIHAFEHAAATSQDRVLLLGAGGLGLCAALIASDLGLQIDIWDKNEHRLAALSTAFPNLHPRKPKNAEYDVVLDLTGSISGLELACGAVVGGGRLVSMSHLDGYGSSEFLLPALTRRDVWFIVSYLNGEKSTLSAAIELLQRSWSGNLDELLQIAPIDSLSNLMERYRSNNFNKCIIDTTSWNASYNGANSR